MVLMLRIRK